MGNTYVEKMINMLLGMLCNYSTLGIIQSLNEMTGRLGISIVAQRKRFVYENTYAHKYAYAHTCTHACTHARTHARTHAHMHTCTHAHTHTVHHITLHTLPKPD